MKLICLFIPGVFASNVHVKILKVREKEEKIKLYLMYTFIINMIMFIILNFYCNNPYVLFNDDIMSFNFIMKFMLLSLIISILLPLIYIFIKNNIEIKFIRRCK